MSRPLTAGELTLVETLQKTDARRVRTLMALAELRKTHKGFHITRANKRRIEEMLTLEGHAVIKVVGSTGKLRLYTLEGHMGQVKAGIERAKHLHNGNGRA